MRGAFKGPIRFRRAVARLAFAGAVAVVLVAGAFAWGWWVQPAVLVVPLRQVGYWRLGVVPRTVDVDGHAWPYLESGPADGPPMLFLHGFGTSKDAMMTMAAHFARRGWRTLAPDLPAFGAHDFHPGERHGPAFYAREIGRFMDAVGAPSAVVVGTSMGGALACELAIVYPARTKAILLLCGHFGGGSSSADAAPLGTADYARLSSFLQQKNLRPASLLDAAVLADLQQGMCPVDIPRLKILLSRGAAMGFAVEGWMNKGLWVLCRSDATYPQRLKRKLREMAPPILYGAGEMSLLNGGGLAVVGSRSIGKDEETFTSMVANRCACEGIQVVSGGAKGVDQTSMQEAMAAGGSVVGALADSLLRKSLQKDHRQALHDRRLVMISTAHPEAGFNVGAAMGRNKIIYALADYALVVKADFNKGGTWSGAEEELKRDNACPVFIHSGFSGNKVVQSLSKMGARTFPELKVGIPLAQILSETPAEIPNQSPELFSGKRQSPSCTELPTLAPPEPRPTVSKPEASHVPATAVAPATVFDAVWPLLAEKMKSPRTAAELAEVLELRKPQVEDWLQHACTIGIARKLSKPARYALNSEPRLL